MNADLHCHSTVSDGTLSPEDLARRARTNGVELWALTDHDEVDGVERAAAAAAQVGLPFLAGAELSVSWGSHTLHIVGLGMDPACPELVEGLRWVRSGRERRARAMADDLARAGVRGAYEGALRYVGNPDLISRTHFARFMVETGVCAETGEVFRRFLTPGKPGFIAHQWASLAEAIGWIRAAGGIAVLAHPGRYPLGPQQEWAMIDEFKSLGGEAIEVITGSHTPAEYGHYAQMALDCGLAASCGSDFHAPGESRCDLGSLPPLPASLTPVWALLEDRIR